MAERTGSRIGRLRSGQWLALAAGVLIAAALVSVTLSLLALHRLSNARTLVVDRADPARVAAGTLETALVDQETGVRGYVLTGEPAFLAPYRTGLATALRAELQLQQQAQTNDIPELSRDLLAVGATAGLWQTTYAAPAITAVRQGGRRARGIPSPAQGRALFEAVRSSLAGMDRDLSRARADGRAALHAAATDARNAVLLTGVLLLLATFAASATLRRVVARPIARLARDARRVARGEFDHTVRGEGPRDIVELGTDVDSMRRRIVSELEAAHEARAALEVQAQDLQRSNAELEQFAYVASHDLQEPLRKVASFCGMLQRRYGGQLDERADQYIAYAVDGAERMQELINDLLAFSRVGQGGTPSRVVALDDALAEALANLEQPIAESGATVETDPLPRVIGDRSLLVALWQNLIGNAVKFRSDHPPRVRVSVSTRDGHHRFAVDDNGIGVAPRYADRIFVIFQRLHGRDEYAGTGIGLALCRKIVEHHGGEIWLEPEGMLGGASFGFTLPVARAEPVGLEAAGPDSSDG